MQFDNQTFFKLNRIARIMSDRDGSSRINPNSKIDVTITYNGTPQDVIPTLLNSLWVIIFIN